MQEEMLSKEGERKKEGGKEGGEKLVHSVKLP